MVEIDLFNRRQQRVGVEDAEIRCVGTELDELVNDALELLQLLAVCASEGYAHPG